ncbi:MAG: VWA domain-containing protein [Planctomycetales bacterium]
MIGSSYLQTVALLAAIVGGGPLAAAERSGGSKTPSPEFRTAKREFQQKFRAKQSADRVAALQALAAAPPREAAELVWQAALDDKSPEIRSAAIELLADWREDPEVVDLLLDLLTRATRKAGMNQRSYAVLKALGGTADERHQEQLLKYFDEFLGTPKADQSLVHTLADDLGKDKTEAALRTLNLMSQARYFETNFGYRRCVMQGVVCIPGDDTITFLIDKLPDIKGLVQFDVITYLTRATGQNFRDDAASWKAWWVSQQMKLPQRSDLQPNIPFPGTGAFYGIPIGAKRVVFILDTSGSMEGDKLEAAKRELIAAIKGLTPDVFFGVVAFNRQVFVWQRELVPANERNRQQAINSIVSQQAGSSTSSYDALAAAFELDPEAIYFVSDGAPSTGKVVDPNQIVNTISRFNHVRRVSVHSIGIGTNDTTAAMFGRFMKGLAQADWGEYREVNQ